MAPATATRIGVSLDGPVTGSVDAETVGVAAAFDGDAEDDAEAEAEADGDGEGLGDGLTLGDTCTRGRWWSAYAETVVVPRNPTEAPKVSSAAFSNVFAMVRTGPSSR